MMDKNFEQFTQKTFNEFLGLQNTNQKAKHLSNENYVLQLSKHKNNLIIYWCLCKYCQLYNAKKQEYVDWLFHLQYEIESLKNYKTENQIDILNDYFYIDEKLNDPYKIVNIISKSFKKSNINSIDRMNSVSEIFVNGINGLIDILTNEDSTIDYMNVVFG